MRREHPHSDRRTAAHGSRIRTRSLILLVGLCTVWSTIGHGRVFRFDTCWRHTCRSLEPLTFETHDKKKFTGRYETGGGVIDGTYHRRSSLLTGVWTQKTGHIKCPHTRQGTHYWGRLRLKFSADESGFEGTWGYCDSIDNGGVWRGQNGRCIGGCTPAQAVSGPGQCVPRVPADARRFYECADGALFPYLDCTTLCGVDDHHVDLPPKKKCCRQGCSKACITKERQSLPTP